MATWKVSKLPGSSPGIGSRASRRSAKLSRPKAVGDVVGRSCGMGRLYRLCFNDEVPQFMRLGHLRSPRDEGHK
jgi:hypothetical protein